ncbi:MAG: hypothetical protein ACLUEK_06530 [Oscillospiraceae bacterium]
MGRNGAGKTTLIRLICGFSGHSGTYHLRPGVHQPRHPALAAAWARWWNAEHLLDMSAREISGSSTRVLGLPSFEGGELLARRLADTAKSGRNFSWA